MGFLLFILLFFFDQVCGHYHQSYGANDNKHTYIIPTTTIEGKLSSINLPFVDAQLWCETNVNGSKLATVVDKNVQEEIKQFAKGAEDKGVVISSAPKTFIRLNGVYQSNGSWTWVNGQEAKCPIECPPVGINSTGFSLHLKASVALRNNRVLVFAHAPEYKLPYICEYEGYDDSSCNFRLNDKCMWMASEDKGWYNATNDCIGKGGQLVSLGGFAGSDLKSLVKNISRRYRNSWISASILDSQKLLEDISHYLPQNKFWIGLQNGVWRWDDTGSPIKQTFWENPQNEFACLCSTSLYSYGTWNDCSCDEQYPFICLLNGDFVGLQESDNQEESKVPPADVKGVVLTSSVVVLILIVIVGVVIFVRLRKRISIDAKDKADPSSPNRRTSQRESVYDEIDDEKFYSCPFDYDAHYDTIEMDDPVGYQQLNTASRQEQEESYDSLQ